MVAGGMTAQALSSYTQYPQVKGYMQNTISHTLQEVYNPAFSQRGYAHNNVVNRPLLTRSMLSFNKMVSLHILPKLLEILRTEVWNTTLWTKGKRPGVSPDLNVTLI